MASKAKKPTSRARKTHICRLCGKKYTSYRHHIKRCSARASKPEETTHTEQHKNAQIDAEQTSGTAKEVTAWNPLELFEPQELQPAEPEEKEGESAEESTLDMLESVAESPEIEEIDLAEILETEDLQDIIIILDDTLNDWLDTDAYTHSPRHVRLLARVLHRILQKYGLKFSLEIVALIIILIMYGIPTIRVIGQKLKPPKQEESKNEDAGNRADGER